MSKLYSAGKIGTLEVRNRIVITAMHLAYCPSGEVGEQITEFYRVRAKGGAGLIIIGAVGIDPLRVNQCGMVQIYDDRFIGGLRKLTAAVHGEGSKIFAQLFHAGRYARSAEYGGKQAVAPSAIASRFTGEMPHELTEEEITEIISFFAKAAKRAKIAGFDGIEITGASGYIIAQFLSPLTNQRTDKYGGTLEGRLNFPLLIVAAIQREVGPDFPIMFRVGGNDFMPGGNSPVEVREICQALEKAGVNAIDVTGGWHESRVPQITMDVPEGGYRYLGKIIKSAVNIPIVMCNRMHPRLAEQLVDDGTADFVGMARAFVADPEVAIKAMNSKYDAIRPCVACNQGCLDNVLFGKALSCLVNAEAGREWKLLTAGMSPAKPATSQKVLVIGAGASGLEYARVASLRGHKVTIWEEKQTPGGQAALASIPPGRQDYKRLIAYLDQACKELKVKVQYGKKATLPNITQALETAKFQRIVFATGAQPIPPSIHIEPGASPVQAVDVLKNPALAGQRVVIIGAGALGLETALLLAEAGTLSNEMLRFLIIHQAETPETIHKLITNGDKDITVIDMQQGKGMDLGPTTRTVILGMLKKYGVHILEKTKALEAGELGVVVENEDNQRQLLRANTVIFAEKTRSNNDWFTKLTETVNYIDIIGDALKPGNMQSAIRQAYDAALRL